MEIALPTPAPQGGTVYVGGAVLSPGFYPWHPGDTLEDILARAGGRLPGATPDQVKLLVPLPGEGTSPQRVNLNTTPRWLLEALPGIGEKLSQAIMDYRDEHGGFRSVDELALVPGIGPALVERLRPLVTVGE